MAHKEIAVKEMETQRTEIEPWDPFRDLKALSGVSGLFEDLLGTMPATRFMATKAWAPRVEIKETEKEYVIAAALPGVRKEDVKIAVENGVLTLSGHREEDKEEKGKNYLRRELMYGAFQRSFSLPLETHPEDVRARFSDGMLRLALPKPPVQKSRAVSIKVE